MFKLKVPLFLHIARLFQRFFCAQYYYDFNPNAMHLINFEKLAYIGHLQVGGEQTSAVCFVIEQCTIQFCLLNNGFVEAEMLFYSFLMSSELLWHSFLRQFMSWDVDLLSANSADMKYRTKDGYISFCSRNKVLFQMFLNTDIISELLLVLPLMAGKIIC